MTSRTSSLSSCMAIITQRQYAVCKLPSEKIVQQTLCYGKVTHKIEWRAPNL